MEQNKFYEISNALLFCTSITEKIAENTGLNKINYLIRLNTKKKMNKKFKKQHKCKKGKRSYSKTKKKKIRKKKKSLKQKAKEDKVESIGRSLKPQAGGFPYSISDNNDLCRLMRNGKNVTQQIEKYNYKNWKDAANDQYQDHNYGNWKDPSATGKLIISRIDIVKNKNRGLEDGLVVCNKCPSEIDLVKVFGNNINFIYISPPWYIKIFDCRGYVKLEHIRKLPIGIDKFNLYQNGSIQLRGFVFIWIPLYYFTAIHKIMEDKGYSYCDMVSASKTDLNGSFDTRSFDKRNIGPIGRIGGITIHGCLFKQIIAKGSTKPRFIIGNQIMTDTIEHNWVFDERTGQIIYPDGHAYQLYDYLICHKMFNSKNISALHLWSRRRCIHQGMAGVYFPGPFSKTLMKDIPEVWTGEIPTINFKEFEDEKF